MAFKQFQVILPRVPQEFEAIVPITYQKHFYAKKI